MDPLSHLGRNEPCWCGSHRKYKTCHGIKRPASAPGAAVPADEPGVRYISPTVKVETAALIDSLGAGIPITLPRPEPTPHLIPYTSWEQSLSSAVSHTSEPMDAASLGRLRVEVLHRISRVRNGGEPPNDQVLEAIYRLAGETIKTVDSLARTRPKPTVLWNEELDVSVFMGRTLLLADHVLVPDDVFSATQRSADMAAIGRKASEQLGYADLIASGIAIPVPNGVAMAHQGQAAQRLTAQDLSIDRLTRWVRNQLIFEGPTAREALLVSAADDLSTQPANFWMYGRIFPDSLDDETGRVTMGMLLAYDPDHDYSDWMRQVSDSATSFYVQRTNQRIVTADVFAADYVSASMFEARLLRQRGTHPHRPAQSAVWADVPALTSLASPDLAEVLRHEDAIADLRERVRSSLATARSLGEEVDALTDLAHDLESSSHRLEKKMSTDRFWQGFAPGGLGAAALVIGGFTGGIPGLVAGGVGAAAGLTPYLGSRRNDRRDAAYLFVAGRRASRN